MLKKDMVTRETAPPSVDELAYLCRLVMHGQPVSADNLILSAEQLIKDLAGRHGTKTLTLKE